MAVIGIDHVNIRTPDVSASLRFFRDVLEMTVTPPPGRSSISDSGWVLDGNGHAAIHVGSTSLAFPGDDKQAAVASRGSGAVHHVALNCGDYAATRDRFARLGLSFTENHIRAAGLRQIFVHEPNGVLIELNFREA